MKSKYANRILFVIAGALIGTIFAYFGASSVSSGNLVTGALFGSAFGIFFAVSRQPGMG